MFDLTTTISKSCHTLFNVAFEKKLTVEKNTWKTTHITHLFQKRKGCHSKSVGFDVHMYEGLDGV